MKSKSGHTYQIEYRDGKDWRPMGLASSDNKQELVMAMHGYTSRHKHPELRLARYRRVSVVRKGKP